MKDQPNTPEVIIVGGGPCGLFAGLLLARKGVRCVVLEKKEGLSTHPKAMGISRRTSEIFRQTGLLGHLEKGSLPLDGRCLGIWSKSLVGEELGRIALADVTGPLTPCSTLHCPQTWTEHVIYEALKHEPLASVQFGVNVESVEATTTGATIHLGDGTTLESDWVLAADGAGSHLRKHLGIGTDGPGDLGHFVNVFFRANYGAKLEDRRALLYQALGKDFFEFFVAVNGTDLWLMHHFLQPGETAEDFVAPDIQAVIQRASGLPEEPIEVLGVSPWVMSPKVAKTWRHDRLLLVGDAAARLSPAGGLGLNNGLQSVHNLAWKLAGVINEGASESLLDTYELERRSTALWLMKNTNRNADEIFVIVAAAMRDDWAAVRDGISHSRRHGSGLGQDLGVIYDGGAFLPDGTEPTVNEDPVNDYHPSGRPGGRAPHVEIQNAGDKTSSLDFFGRGFVVLAGRAAGSFRADSQSADFLQNGTEFESQAFEHTYGITSAGAVLVRPDGVVAARFADSSGPETPDAVVSRVSKSGILT
ncbi:MAG: FAD-dependent monooxygenase [Terrimicrobiaceae bacterium]